MILKSWVTLKYRIKPLRIKDEGPLLINDTKEELLNESVEGACVNVDADEPDVQDDLWL